MALTIDQKASICLRELWGGEGFLDDHERDLRALLSDSSFMTTVRRIATGMDSEHMYAEMGSPQIQRFKQAINQAMWDAHVYYDFPAYARIGDDLVSRRATKKSVAITVFYGVCYLSLKEGVDPAGAQGSAPAGLQPVPEEPQPAGSAKSKLVKVTVVDRPAGPGASAAPAPALDDRRAPKGDELVDFRLRYPAQYRCEDGHYVRSKNEALVDNWLYSHGVVHAYEKAVFSSEQSFNYCSDFFLPEQGLFIEIWGNVDAAYAERKARKIAFYERCGYRLLSIEDSQVRNLDDILSRAVIRGGR